MYEHDATTLVGSKNYFNKISQAFLTLLLMPLRKIRRNNSFLDMKILSSLNQKSVILNGTLVTLSLKEELKQTC
jgi:hypothetical protein